MSSYLNINLEIKKKDTAWEHVDFGKQKELWFQGDVRDYFSMECEYYSSVPSDATEDTKKQIAEVGYNPRVFVFSLNEISGLADKERLAWLKSYKEALSKNFFVKKLEEVMGKKLEQTDEDWEHSEENLNYLENEDMYRWVSLEKLSSILRNTADVAADGSWNLEDARVIMYVA